MSTGKQDILKRLHYIEGHLGGIGKMIEEDTNCIDVLHQTYAVRKAIEKLEALLVENHLSRCVHQSITSGDEEALLTELVRVYHLQGTSAPGDSIPIGQLTTQIA